MVAVCLSGIKGTHGATASAPTTAPAAATVTVRLEPMGLAEGELLVGGASQRVAYLPLNVPLVRRVVLGAQDVQAATLSLVCKRAAARFEGVANGLSANGQTVSLTGTGAAGPVSLGNGDSLALAVWKGDWHYNGGAEVSGLTIARVDGEDRREVALPESGEWSGPSVETPLGKLSLAGLSNRDKFPALVARKEAQAAGKPGSFAVPGASGVTLSVNDGELVLHTNGRAKFDAAFDWAPAIIFTPTQSGRYELRATLKVRCAQAQGKVAWRAGLLTGEGGALKDTRLSLHRVLDAGGRYDAEPLASATIKDDAGGTLDFASEALTAAVRRWAAGEWADYGVALVAKREDGAASVIVAAAPKGTLVIREHPKDLLFDHAIKPQKDVYATIKDGRLYYGDRRLRLWGMVKDAPAERLRRLGFNCLRAWFQGDFYTDDSARRGRATDSKPGDGSRLDQYDRMIADMKANGVFIMLATTVGPGMPLKPLLADDSWLAGGDDWADWKKAVEEAGGGVNQFAYVDERLWKIRLRHAENVFTHVNPYTGRSYAQEEAIALVEINNEAGLVKSWLEKGFDKWPAYFRDQLARRWNAWLKERYADDTGLRKAWGQLDDGESLAQNTVRPAPLLGERGKCPAARQSDFVRFLYGLIDSRNQNYRTFCRSLAPKGVGVNVVPFSFDSQYRPSVPWLYTNWLGDTSTVSMYFWGNDSMLTRPPGLYVLDSHRLADKLSVIYETQRGRPSRYRAEYPYMLAAMTDWQDFDIVVWHGNWIGANLDEQLLAGGALPPATTHFWNGVHLEHDPVMSAAVALAGRIFLTGGVGTADDPVTYTVGAGGIFSLDNFNGIGGREMSLATFTRGSRIVLKPDSPGGVQADGKPVAPAAPVTTALAMGKHVLWDWPRGRLIIDSPTVKVYAGRTCESHRFEGGITLSGFDTPFVAFAMVSADGRPLTGPDACRRAYVSAVFDARNTGFDYDYQVPGGPIEQAKAVKKVGHPPVIVDRVAYTLSLPTTVEATVSDYDFALRRFAVTELRAGALRREGATPWMTVLEFASRGAPATPRIDPSPGAAIAATQTSAPAGAETTDPKLAAVPNPLPGISWGDSYHLAHRTLRDAAAGWTVSKEDLTSQSDKTITLSDAVVLMKTPASVEAAFAGGRMTRIVVTFAQAPALSDLVSELTRMYGRPSRSRIVSVASEQSEVEWISTSPAGTLTVAATEVQGVVRVTYSLQR
jgi:hypothetical protein